jgi:hypothetical protein
MSVLDVVLATSAGGTFSEPSIQAAGPYLQMAWLELEDASNAKLVFRTTLVCDAAGSGLYLKAKHARRSVRPLRRKGDDV